MTMYKACRYRNTNLSPTRVCDCQTKQPMELEEMDYREAKLAPIFINVNIASNISNSAIVQGNKANTIEVINEGASSGKLTEYEAELLRIYRSLDVKKKTALMTFAFELENK